MGRTRFSGPVKSTGGFETGATGTNTTAIGSDGTLHQKGTEVTATAAELNKMDGVTATAAELNQIDGNILSDMTPGTGISTGTGTICEHSVVKVGGIFKTEILIDLTGLNGCNTAGDIIGKDGGTANCHIGQITTAVNGTIIAGLVECHEAPAGGNVDIDIYSATVGTGVQDTAIGDLTETALANCDAHSAGSSDYFTAWPAANGYLYLTVGTATDANYSAGRLLITLWGV